ncbi:MAG: CD225/dispanin family protein [Dysgonomonas sp.]
MSELNDPNNQNAPNAGGASNQPPKEPFGPSYAPGSNQQGAQYYNQGQSYNQNRFDVRPKPDNSLVLSIVGAVLATCTSCIGVITGIIAVVFALQVDSKFAAGDYDGAESAAQTAKIMAIVTMVLNVLAIVGGIIYFVIVGAALLSEYQ